MEYERIHKPQTGIISPSKLRMKLMGAHNQKKKDGSNSNSARTSPSKLQDADFVKSSLLATQSGDFEEEASLGVGADHTSSIQARELFMPRDDDDGDSADLAKLQNYSRGGGDSCNSSSVHPVKSNEDENNLDYDSTSSFEFHKNERSMHQHVHMTRSYSRPMSSKWNDAEKWIMNRQSMPGNYAKKPYFQNQANRPPASSFSKVAPESATYENKLSLVKRVDVCQTAPQSGHEKFIFLPAGSLQNNADGSLIDLCPESRDLMEVDMNNSSTTRTSTHNSTAIRAVSMRDMGTEMTPIPSQEPSRTASPLGSTTPMRSPTSSIPSTPRRGE
ncbi:hypothetical protein Leryth_000190 [Lithospermum erythrorhizon]|nr:hypothetical protein Leryth_000190 [Lithospermum erythrorhizon]